MPLDLLLVVLTLGILAHGAWRLALRRRSGSASVRECWTIALLYAGLLALVCGQSLPLPDLVGDRLRTGGLLLGLASVLFPRDRGPGGGSD